MARKLISPQYKLGSRGLIFLIFLLNMTGPMSTDLYLAAFPTLLKQFNTTGHVLNYTLVGFFVSFAIGMLFIGPLSDKIGRKPVLLSGILIYGVSSLLCSFAPTVESLICFRIMQAIGAGGMISVSMAMVKDSFSDKDRPEIIAFLQMLGAFAPTVAPLIRCTNNQTLFLASYFRIISCNSIVFFYNKFICNRNTKKRRPIE